MRKIFILGSGRMGSQIAALLAATGQYAVTVADRAEPRLDLPVAAAVERRQVDARDAITLRRALAGQDIVVSACPYFLNLVIAEAARDCGVHYFDLTEDVETARAIGAIAAGADTVFAPQCGLAPGFVGIVAHHMAQEFDQVQSIQMRVGALPVYPVNSLKYNLTWSTDGLINEYCNPCDAIVDGRRAQLLPLEGLERFSLDGVDYEAFNTSGGLGSLCETLAGKVAELTYKTVRYPGHRDILRLLLHDLDLQHDRQTLQRIFERAIPKTDQDVVVLMVNAIGEKRGRLCQETFSIKVYGDGGASAIQATTAGSLCAMVDLFAAGRLRQRGLIRQEDVTLPDFLGNRFGSLFRPPSHRIAA